MNMVVLMLVLTGTALFLNNNVFSTPGMNNDSETNPIYYENAILVVEEIFVGMEEIQNETTNELENVSQYVSVEYWYYENDEMFLKFPDDASCFTNQKGTKCYLDVNVTLHKPVETNNLGIDMSFVKKPKTEGKFKINKNKIDKNNKENYELTKGNHILTYEFDYETFGSDKFNISLLGVEIDPEIDGCTTITEAGTYIMNQSITDSSTSYCMNISANDVILDCAGYTIDGNDAADYGIYVKRASAETTNVTIKNCIVSDWDTANIYLRFADGNNLTNIITTSSPDKGISISYLDSNTFTNITANSNDYGFHISNLDSNTFTNLTANSNNYGIYMVSSNSNTFTNITANSNDYGFHIIYTDLTTVTNMTVKDNYKFDISYEATREILYCNSEFINVIGTDDKPIVFYNTSTTIQDWNNNVSEIILCGADNSVINNLTMNRIGTENNGLLIVASQNVSVLNSQFIDLERGIFIYYSDSNIFTNLSCSSNTYGLYSLTSDSNTFTNITANSNTDDGMYFSYSDLNSMVDLTIYSNLDDGIYLDGSDNTLRNSTIYSQSGSSDVGVYIDDDHNIIENVSVYSNYYNIYLDSTAQNNTIANSSIYNAGLYGIYIKPVSTLPNFIYNNLFNQTTNVYFSGTIYTNNWNTTEQTGTRIYSNGTQIGGNYWTNSTGNDYSDTCNDSDTDGFCDDYYNLTNSNIDWLPLSVEYVLADNNVSLISSISDTPDPVGYGNNVTINSTVTDDDSISVVLTEITYPNSTSVNYTMQNITVTVYQYNFTDTWQNGEYSYKIYANNSNNQWSSSATYTFNVSINANFSLRTINDSYILNNQVNLTDPPLETVNIQSSLKNSNIQTDISTVDFNKEELDSVNTQVIDKNGTVFSKTVYNFEKEIDVIIELKTEPIIPYNNIAKKTSEKILNQSIYKSLNDGESVVQIIKAKYTNIYMDKESTKKITTLSLIEEHNNNIIDEIETIVIDIQNINNTKNVGSKKYKYIMNGFTATVKQEDIEKIKKMNNVKNVWIDEIVTTQVTVMPSVIQMNADDVWNKKDATDKNITGVNVTVAVLDTGIDYTHPDLGNCTEAKFLEGTCERITWGWDYHNNDNNPIDDNGHGTHVAGIIGANGTLKGVAPDVKFLAYKVCSSGGSCYSSNVISAIENATLRGADVISMSLGGSGYSDSVYETPINNAINNGTVVVIAAGNSGPNNDTVGSPGTTLSAITVGAIDSSNNIASFSSRGYAYYSNGSVSGIKPDIVSYGVNINSTVPNGSCIHCENNGYKSLSGTSMATPHVAGGVALLKQAYPNWSAIEIKSAIVNPAIDLGYVATTQGNGNVDVLKSYNSDVFVKEVNIFMGINSQNDTGQWNTTYNFNLSNPTITTNLYNLTYLGENGILSNNSIILNPNESIIINLTLNINNTLFNDGKFFNKININSNNSINNISIPISFYKTKYIILNTGDGYWYTNIVTSGGSLNKLTTRNGIIFLDKGEYYLESVLSGCPDWVGQSCLFHEYTIIFNYINLTNSINVYANKSMAIYKLNYSFLDKNNEELITKVYPNGEYNRPYQCQDNTYDNYACADRWALKFVFNNSFISTFYSVGTIAPIYFNNDISNLWTFSHFHTVNTNDSSIYIAKAFVSNISKNQTLISNNWLNLTINYDYPLNNSELTRSYRIELFHGDNYISTRGTNYRDVFSDMNNYSYETLYITPNINTSDELENASTQERVGEFISLHVVNTSKDGVNGLKWYESPLLYPVNMTTWEMHLFDWYIPHIDSIFIISDNEYTLGNTTSYWYGVFTNTGNPSDSNQITLTPQYGTSIRHILKQNNVWQGTVIPVTYNLINTTQHIVSSGTINLENFKLTELPQTTYTMTFKSENVDKVNTVAGTIYINTTFNLSATDKNPPSIEFIRFLSNNKTTNYINSTNENRLIFDSSDATSQNVYYRANGDQIWLELTITNESYYKNASFPSLTQGYYDFRYNSSDSAGNTLIQENIPAFYILDTSDTIAPTITIVSPINQSYINTWLWANATLNENGDWCGYSLDGTANQTMSNTSTTEWYYNVTSLSEVSHNITFSCNDTEGNMGTSTTTYFTVDTTGYIISSLNSTLSLVLTDNENINLNTNTQTGVKQTRLKKGTKKIADIYINFTNSFDWSDVSADEGNYTSGINTLGRSYIHIPDTHTEVINKTLYIPAVLNSGEFYICPNATSLTDVNDTCPNLVRYYKQPITDGYYSIIASGTGGSEDQTKSMINNTGTTDFNGYLLLKLQKNESGTWNDFTTIINDTTSRNISSLNTIALDVLWYAEGSWTANETGTFRVYGHFADPDGNILQTDDGTYLNATYNFTVSDSTAPTITINNPTTGTYFNENWVLLNYSVSDDNNATVTCYYTLDSSETASPNNPITNNTIDTINLTSLSETSHTISVKCDDGVQNGTSSTNTFYIDLTNPTITSPSPANNSYVLGSATQTFSITVNDGVSLNTSSGLLYEKYPTGAFYTSHTMECTTSSCTYDLDMSSANDGDTWSYYFEIKDMAGNTGVNGTNTVPLTVTIDKAGPAINIILPENTTYGSTNRTLNYTVTDVGVGIDACWYNYNSSNTTLSSCTNTTFTALDNQQSTITVYSNDTLGNENSENVLFTVDTTTPTNITFVSPTETNNSNKSQNYYYVNVTFNETNPDTCILESNSINYTMTKSGKNCYLNQTSQADATYIYRVYVNDTIGHINVSDDKYVTLDTITPTITIYNPTNTSYNSVTVNLNVSADEAIATWIYTLNGGIWTQFTQNTNITAIEGNNNITIAAYDYANNVNMSSTIYFTVDTTAPTVDAYYQWNSTNETMDLTYISDGSMTINWNVSDVSGINVSSCSMYHRYFDNLTQTPIFNYINGVQDTHQDENGYHNMSCENITINSTSERLYYNFTEPNTYLQYTASIYYNLMVDDGRSGLLGDKIIMARYDNHTTGANKTIKYGLQIYNSSATTAPFLVSLCNKYADTTAWQTETNCLEVGSFHVGVSTPNSEGYYTGLITTNGSGYLGPLLITDTMYAIGSCPDCTNANNDWEAVYTNINNDDSFTSANNGAGWTAVGWEFNTYANYFNEARFEANLTVSDNLGNLINDYQFDYYGDIPEQPPAVAINTDNVTGGLISYYDIHNITESGIIWFNASVADDLGHGVNCTFYLLNNDTTMNTTLLTDYNVPSGFGTCPYEWNTSTLPDGDYRVKVSVTDGVLVNNRTGAGFIRLASDTTAPVISNIIERNIRYSTVDLTWSTDEDANSSISISPTGTYSNSSAYTTAHAIAVSGLESNTNYEYTITTCDSNDNCNTSTQSFTTASASSSGGAGGCIPVWECTEWSYCINETQTRTCVDNNMCGTNTSIPDLNKTCSSIPIIIPSNETTNFTLIDMGNYTWPWTPTDGVYHPTRLAAVISSILSHNLDETIYNLLASFGDYYYRPSFDWGILSILFMHITPLIIFYFIIGLLIKSSKIVSKSSKIIKFIIYGIIIPLLVLFMTLIMPST